MRLFSATLATETNTFSPLPTSLENYRESVRGAGSTWRDTTVAS